MCSIRNKIETSLSKPTFDFIYFKKGKYIEEKNNLVGIFGEIYGKKLIWKLMTNGREEFWTVGTFLMLENIVDTFTGKFVIFLEANGKIS
jgi:hypothetical protein